jgi:hypothetical protein
MIAAAGARSRPPPHATGVNGRERVERVIFPGFRGTSAATAIIAPTGGEPFT